MKKLATFGWLWAFFSHGNLSLSWEFLNWSANESKILSLSDQSLEGRCWRCPGDWGEEVQRGRVGRECVVSSGYRSSQRQDWVVILKKMISITQLNYKGSEKSHATEELVGYTTRNLPKCILCTVSAAVNRQRRYPASRGLQSKRFLECAQKFERDCGTCTTTWASWPTGCIASKPQ